MENEDFYLLESLYPESGFDPRLSKLIEDAKRPVGPDIDVSRFKHIVTALYLKSKHKINNKAFDELRQLAQNLFYESSQPKRKEKGDSQTYMLVMYNASMINLQVFA